MTMKASPQGLTSAAGFISRKLLGIIAGGTILVCLLLVGFVWVFGSDDKKPGSAHNASDNPLHGASFYVDPNAPAATQAAAWRSSRPTDAAQMDKLAALPSANWIGIDSDIRSLPEYIQAAQAAGQVPITVAYNIPQRDCGLYSQGGAADDTAYRAFIDGYVAALGTAKNIIILEPDAVAYLGTGSCLNSGQQQGRYQLLNYAIDSFKRSPNTFVYLDAGNSAWQTDIQDVAMHLKASGLLKADGFSLNVSNFRPIDETIAYGKQLSALLEQSHFVIDTSRNGAGPFTNPDRPEYNWCNPPDRALGHYPTTNTGEKLVDAYLYIKVAGESDGQDADPKKCFGGPKPGVWWPEYALGLIERWPAALQP